MTNNELLAIVRAHRADSLGVEDGELSSQRAQAMDHYHGRPYGNEVVGRSQVVSRDLAETVDWALPAVLRPFISTGELAVFDPVGPEDEQQAQQESDYVNQVLMKDNNGFMLLHDVFKDTMLLKNGYAKHFWEENTTKKEREYKDLTMEGIQKLLSDLKAKGAEVEILGQDSRMAPIPGMPMPQTPATAIMAPPEVELFDIKLSITRTKGRLVAMAVPAEEVRVSRKCRGSLQESPFVEHVTKKTRSELIEMGMRRDFVDSLPAYNEDNTDEQSTSRDSVTDESNAINGNSVNDRSMDEIEFCESYILVDFDGDGVAERRKVVTAANRIPPGDEWNEPIEAVPMTGFVMKRVPHRHVGESFDDEISDLQEIKTTLQRQLLDNVYLTNNQRTAVNDLVNTRDLLVSTPGGVVRTKGESPPGNNIMPLVTQPILDKILPLLDYWDRAKEVRSGIRPGSDIDPEVLQQVTKGAFMEHMNRLSQKIEMMTRLLGEGVKELVLQCHAILNRHQDMARKVQMRGKWVEVNPSEWEERTDLTVRVGLGTGNQEDQRQKLQMLSQFQGQLLQAVMAAPLPVYEKMYSLFVDMCSSLGFDTPEKYAIAPQSEEYMALQQEKAKAGQQPPPEVLKIQQQGQLEQMRMQAQQQIDANRQEMEAQQQQARMSMERELAEFKARLDAELEMHRISVKAETDREIAMMNNQSKLDAAQITAQTTLTAQQESASDNATGDVV
jgi:uncharacterized ParB-like nuclease family protein